MKKVNLPIRIFFDGSCSVCASEIRHYKSRDIHGNLLLVDISKEDFQPEKYGKTMEDFMTQMHVLDQQGQFFLGVNAFPAIWQALPGRLFAFLAMFMMLPGIHSVARLAYILFAKYRRNLFPKKNKCETGTCDIKPL